MEYKKDLRSATVVWWRFFWRYAVVFALLNFTFGLAVNIFGHFLPTGLFTFMLFSGVGANMISSLLMMHYCMCRKFRNSPMILLYKTDTISIRGLAEYWKAHFHTAKH